MNFHACVELICPFAYKNQNQLYFFQSLHHAHSIRQYKVHHITQINCLSTSIYPSCNLSHQINLLFCFTKPYAFNVFSWYVNCCGLTSQVSFRVLHLQFHSLTHWGQATHIWVSKLTIIASDNGLSPGRRQAIIWNNAGILSIGLFGTKFSEILIEILTFSLKKMRLKVSSAKWWPFCLGLNVLTRLALESFAIAEASGNWFF